MPNQLALGRSSQRTSAAMLVTANDIFTQSGVRQSSPASATVINTPPIFAGITGATPNADGSINVQWAAATSVNLPFEYQVYIAPGSVSAATLFALKPVVLVDSPNSNVNVFKLTDQSTYLVKDQVYTLGVRVRDGVKNQNTNLTTLTATAIASGNLISLFQTVQSQLAATQVLLAADHVNFQGDHVNFQGDHTNFQTDHTNFLADHANFQADHVNLNQDHLNIAADHINLNQDHLNFVTDHTNFQGDHTNFQTDHTNLQTDHTNFQGDHTAFQGDRNWKPGTTVPSVSVKTSMNLERGGPRTCSPNNIF